MESSNQRTGVRRSGFGELVRLACFVALGITAATANDGTSDENQLSIDVRVYNYTQVTAEVVTKAEGGAAEVFHAAGIEIAWVNCKLPEDSRCASPLDPAHLGVRIIADFGPTPGTTHRTMGLASGDMASVSLRRVREDAAEFGVSLEAVLGPAFAHEIGHLLLGQRGHSPNGIMRARWRREDYERAPRGAFKFTTQQAEQIRAEANKRAHAEGAAEVATATATNQ